MANDLPRVTLYSRPGCHLCEAAEADLRGMIPELRFALDVINIEDDDELHRKYIFEIPVIVAEGQQVAAGRVVAAAVREELRDLFAARR